MQDTDDTIQDEPAERPWIALHTTYDVEAWIDSYNRDLQHAVKTPNPRGQGICFGLAHGGDIYLHTDTEGNAVLDVTPDAAWVTPLISAATGIDAPPGRIWALPGHTLTQLIFGLSSLIASTRIVRSHDFRVKKY